MSKEVKQKWSLPPEWNFPPFFTIQKVSKTRQNQFEMWTHLITGYLELKKKTNIYILKECSLTPFTNKKIKRALKPNDLRQILDYMSSLGYGSWDDEEKTIFSCSWKKMDEWANLIYSWANNEGQIGKILTLFDLHSGDSTSHTQFAGIENQLLLKILNLLEEEGKVVVYKDGNNIDEYGVKFFQI